MLSNLPTSRAGSKPRKTWAGAAVLILGFLCGSSGILAAAPPANTIIGNQASASYLDPNNNSQLTTSNLVQTTVQQVGSFTLDTLTTTTTTVVNSKTGAAGSTLYAPHILTNTGNGTDTFNVSITSPASPNGFTQVQVFADANGDGQPDSTTALCTATSPATTCSVPVQTIAGNNGVFQFVVAYTIPANATSGTFSSPATATVTAAPVATGLYATGNTTAADVDGVSLTTGAAFNATIGLSAPAVAWSANSGNWPTVLANGQRSPASGCALTTAGAATPAAGCAYSVYTLSFNNSGATAGAFTVQDTLPAGLTYIPGSAIWSSAPGTALSDTASGNPAGIDYKVSANVVTAVVNSLGPNVFQTVSFVVLVNNTAAVGTSSTTNSARYSPLDSTGSTSSVPTGATSTTNGSPFTVTGTFGVVMGSATGTATTAVDTSAGVPNATTSDTTTVATAVAGSTVKFTQTVFNTGNASDTMNLTASIGTFPAGTTFKFFAADGLTPSIDNNGDGTMDTGPVAAGASTTIVVAATLPAMAASTGPFSAIITATSAGDSTKSETTRDTITSVIGVLVDLTNTASGNGTSGTTGNGDVGAGPSPQPTLTHSTPAGTVTTFQLFVKNNDANDNTYTLAASQTTSFPGSLPTGWTVKFVASGALCSATGITQVAVPHQTQVDVVACVTPPATQVAVTAQYIYFQVQTTTATSNGSIARDTLTDAVTVTAAATYSATLTPNNNGQVSQAGTVVYAHTLTNTGAQSCVGPYTVAATLPAADVTAGWTTALYIDNNGDGQLDSGDSLITTGSIAGPLAAGATKKLLLKVFSPGGVGAGASDSATLTVTFPTGATSCGAPSATDVTVVVSAQIRLQKLQALDATCVGGATPSSAAALVAAPGQCITYQVTATNQGAAPVSQLSINDAVPAFTSLTGATQPGTRCSSTGTSPAFTNSSFTSPGSTVGCSNSGSIVSPSGTATLNFSVKVNK